MKTHVEPRLRPYVRAAAGLGVLGLGLCVLNGAFGLGEAFSQYLYPLAYLPAAVLCLLRAQVVRRERMAWTAFGFGYLLWAGGNAYYGGYIHNAEAPPYPSVADALWLPFYPVVYCGLVALVRARAKDFRLSLWLDGLIGALALGALGAALLVEPILTATRGNTAATVVTFAYPAGDLALLIVALTVGAMMGWRIGRDWLLIAAALVIQVCVDTYYVYASVTGSYQMGTLLDSTWVFLSLVVAFAAWHRPAGKRRVNLDDWRVHAVPMGFALVALLILILGNFDRFHEVIGGPSALLAAGTLLAALARAGLTFKEKRSLREAAMRDPLTGLLNYGAFHDAINREVTDCIESEGVFSVVILDLDGFKEVNDLGGHAEGDRVLQSVAKVIHAAPRSSDLTCRLGGDEFGLVLRGLDGREAATVAERVRERLRQRDLGLDVSYGIGEWPIDGPEKATLLLRADTALYATKEERAVARRRAGTPTASTRT